MVEVILQNEQTLLHQSSPRAHIPWVFLKLVPEFCSREAQTYDPATFVVSFALVETSGLVPGNFPGFSVSNLNLLGLARLVF